MIETSGVIEKEQGNGFYLVTLEQPAGHQCLCRAAGKLTKFRINEKLICNFEIEPFRKKCVLEGLDDIGISLQYSQEIKEFEEGLKQKSPWIFR